MGPRLGLPTFGLLTLAPLPVLAAPCDVYGAAGTPCVGAFSLVRSMFSAYDGGLYQVTRTDNATIDVGVLVPGGVANASAQTAFCGTTLVKRGALAAPLPPLGSTASLVPADLPTLSFRHCDGQGFVTGDGTPPDMDHIFKVVAPLNGAAHALSFQSTNYPTYYIAPVAGAEPGRVGIVQGPDAGDASWLVTPLGGTPPAVSLTCLGSTRGGAVLSVGTNLTGGCAGSYSPPSASVYLGPPGAPSSSWLLDVTTPPVCVVSLIYDQSGRGNHLAVAPAGGAVNRPDQPVDASRLPLTVGGHDVYGAYFSQGQGYRIDNTSGVAKGNDPQTIYMVTSGTRAGPGCCFDWGSAEVDNHDDGPGTMEAVYFGTWNATASGWCGGSGPGPWVMADLEDGLWACGSTPGTNPTDPGLGGKPYVTAMLKGGTDGFALKGGDATAAALPTLYDGPRPAGYQPMRKQGALLLGIGGDNSDSAIGSFFEGCVLAGYSTQDADDAVQADIAGAGYGV